MAFGGSDLSHPHPPQLVQQLKNELQTRYSLSPNDNWIHSFLSTVRSPAPPLQALSSTAHFRLLTTDITESLSVSPHTSPSSSASSAHSSVFPTDVANVQVKSSTLSSNIPVQVLDIEDLSTSKYAQIEAIERIESGEEIRGREVIRVVPGVTDGDDDDGSATSTSTNTRSAATNSGPGLGSAMNGRGRNENASSVRKSQGPHRLLLQDAQGTKVYALEMEHIDKIFLTNYFHQPLLLGQQQQPPQPLQHGVGLSLQETGMSIGAKLLLKQGTIVRRGMVMLRVRNVLVMGGKVEAWDRKWREGRKENLKKDMERQHGQNNSAGGAEDE